MKVLFKNSAHAMDCVNIDNINNVSILVNASEVVKITDSELLTEAV